MNGLAYASGFSLQSHVHICTEVNFCGHPNLAMGHSWLLTIEYAEYLIINLLLGFRPQNVNGDQSQREESELGYWVTDFESCWTVKRICFLCG